MRREIKWAARIGAALVVIKPIIWFIDTVGQVDVVTEHFGQLGPFLSSGWGTLATVLGGCCLIAWAVHRSLNERIGLSKGPELAPASLNASVQSGSAFIGGDNNGTQQVFHGSVTVNQTAITPIAPEYPGREFLPTSLTIERLTANFDGKTILQAQALLKPYMGKWMRVTGKVRSVSQRHGGSFHVLLAIQFDKKQFPFIVSCDFAKSWETRMHALAIKDVLTVIGILDYIAVGDLSLEKCAIED